MSTFQTPSLRRATSADLPALLEIERRAFPSPWPEGAFARELDLPQAEVWIAETEAGPRGYLDLWLLVGEVEILNVAVDPVARRQGFGVALVSHAIQRANDVEAGSIFLEVRRSNESAIALYQRCGFHQVGLRKRYYQDNAEDAVLMAWTGDPAARE